MSELIKIAEWTGLQTGTVVFVHGLGGHFYNTWKRAGEEEAFWPLWLARDVEGLTVYS